MNMVEATKRHYGILWKIGIKKVLSVNQIDPTQDLRGIILFPALVNPDDLKKAEVWRRYVRPEISK